MREYNSFKENSVTGRYVTMEHLRHKWFGKHDGVTISDIGVSVLGEQIRSISLGHGPQRILMWSQMHGNESTTTKAVLDVVNFLMVPGALSASILDNCSLCIIPILNPDGAERYTRENANGIDLNRDAKDLSQPESRVLRNVFESFKPDYCFNLHDQRTLFGVGETNKPATVSFLSPASDPQRKMTPAREISMRLIVGMNDLLQKTIPGQVGRYDDSFNDNCVGDTFQMLEVPTLLFEAGHHPGDYDREVTRMHIFHAILRAVETIGLNKIENFYLNEYFNIPHNEKSFFDVLIKKPHTINPNLEEGQDIGIRYKEVLQNGSIRLEPEIASVGKLDKFFGHWVIDCSNTNHREQLLSEEHLLALVSSAEKI